jgi:predicted ABC-type ATPase
MKHKLAQRLKRRNPSQEDITSAAVLIQQLQGSIELAEDWAKKQVMSESSICVATIKTLRRRLNELNK